MSLRRAFFLISAILAIIAAGAGGSLVVLTTILHRVTLGIETAVESVRVAEELEIALLTHRQTQGTVNRLLHEERLRDLIEEATVHASSPEESALISTLGRQVDEYVGAVRRAAVAGPPLAEIQAGARAEFEAAFASARELIQINVQQSRALRDTATRWDRMANVIGLAVAGASAASLVALAYWLRTAAFLPARQLAAAIERYASGERSSRASERGAAELRTIARRFNDMASALEHQRAHQLAFLAGVAHDLRNPLAALKMASDAIAPDRPLPPEERVRRSFARVQRQIDRLERMVDDLLDAARIEAGTLDLQIEECDVREIARAAVDLFQPTAPAHRFAVDAPDRPVLLSGDPARLEQVLNNLISNAIKYSPQGGLVRVAVEQDERSVSLSVADEGVGISPEDLPQIFEPFRRTSASRGAFPGVGLGLFVVRRIAEAHGGRITVESTPGSGSTFTVRIPAGLR